MEEGVLGRGGTPIRQYWLNQAVLKRTDKNNRIRKY